MSENLFAMSDYAGYFRSVSEGIDRIYSDGIEAIEHNNNNRPHLANLSHSLFQLSRIERRQSLKSLWLLGSAYIESLHDNGIKVSQETLDVCKHLGRCVHLVSAGGPLDRSDQEFVKLATVLRTGVDASTSSGEYTREIKTAGEC